MADPAAMEEFHARGVNSLPLVTRGDRYATGFDLAQIDDLLDIARDTDGRSLTGAELVDRALRILPAAMRFARQLPPARYEEEIPGMEGVTIPLILPDGTPMLLDDDTPYVPHRTYLGLVRHIVGHGAKFAWLAENPDVDISHPAKFASLGEPEESLGVEQLAERAQVSVDEIHRWWDATAGSNLESVMNTYMGPQTLHDMLQFTVNSLAQHTRQLMSALREWGIEPDGPIGEAEYEGLRLPAGVWN
jgi:hypothetical protein